MTSQDVELFEALAGDALLEFGFETDTTIISPRIRAIADSCRSWWEKHFLPKHESLYHTGRKQTQLSKGGVLHNSDLPRVKGTC